MTETVRQTLARRRQEGDWTDEEILLMAAESQFSVHAYSPRHGAARYRCRELVRAGRLEVASISKGIIYYKVRHGHQN